MGILPVCKYLEFARAWSFELGVRTAVSGAVPPIGRAGKSGTSGHASRRRLNSSMYGPSGLREG